MEILRLVSQHPCPVVGTADVSQKYDIGTEGARKRLDRLEECGLLTSRVIGGTRVWWLTDEGVRYIQRFD